MSEYNGAHPWSVQDDPPNVQPPQAPGVPPQGTQFRIAHVAVTNTGFPFPQAPRAPPGFGIPPSYNVQPTATPPSNFHFMPSQPALNYFPQFPTSSMFFPPQSQFYVNLPNPAPPRLPIPIENKPKKREGWPIKPKPKVSKKSPPKKVAKTKDTKTPSKAKTPSVDYKIKQPKDVSQKVKRSKISKSP